MSTHDRELLDRLVAEVLALHGRVSSLRLLVYELQAELGEEE